MDALPQQRARPPHTPQAYGLDKLSCSKKEPMKNILGNITKKGYENKIFSNELCHLIYRARVKCKEENVVSQQMIEKMFLYLRNDYCFRET